eukprot:4900637-Pyramimonas_sp.AAC.1
MQNIPHPDQSRRHICRIFLTPTDRPAQRGGGAAMPRLHTEFARQAVAEAKKARDAQEAVARARQLVLEADLARAEASSRAAATGQKLGTV